MLFMTFSYNNNNNNNDGPLLCGFNVAIKGLIWQCLAPSWAATMGRRPATMAVGQHAVHAGEFIPVSM